MNLTPPPAMRPGRSTPREGRDRWLLSYADFMTLLLALFVVLYASARVDADKSTNLLEGIQSAFRFSTPPMLIATPIPMDTTPTDDSATDASDEDDPLIILQQQIAAVLEKQEQAVGHASGVSLYQSERGLVLSLASAEFFPEGGVNIPPERRAALATLAPFLGAHSGSLHFEGHTDAQPISSTIYPSNWELSTARAAAVARLFIDEHGIDPHKVVTTGYAEFRPLEDADGPDSQSRNRRVEIIIMQDGELIAGSDKLKKNSDLDRLLEALPPLPPEADDSLKPKDLGPPPPNIPLP